MSSEPNLRILRVATDIYPDMLGGGALHAHKMSDLQAEMGHEVLVLTSDHGEEHASGEDDRKYDLRRFKEYVNPLGNSVTPGMVRELKKTVDDYDVIHAHSHLYLSTNIASLLRRVTDTPLVVTNHGLYSQSAPVWFQKLFLKSVGKFTFNQADRVLCYTDTDKRRVSDLGVSTPISVIHNGVDCTKFRPSRSESEEDQILFVGRLNENKGPHRLITAFNNIAEEFPEYTLKIVGSGPMYGNLQEMISEYGIEDRAELTGEVPNEELPSIYAESRVFALPSLNEGLPRTILESLACGTPAVASSLPQLENLMDGVGRTIEPESNSQLQQALRELLQSDGSYDEMSELGRERVVEAYSWEHTVKETTSEYYELC